MALTDTLEKNALQEIGDPQTPVSKPTTLAAPTFQAPNTIDAANLSSSPNLKEAPPAPMTDFRAFVDSVAPDTSALTANQDRLRGEISNTLESFENRGSRQTEIESELGIPESRANLAELNLQIAQLKKEFDSAIVNEEGVARPIEFITGRQDFLTRQRAVQVGALSSIAQAMQGNIALAEQTAATTIEREFADEEAELRGLEFEYNENVSDLERADKKGAQDLALFIEERRNNLETAKEERRGVIALAQEAAMNGAPNSITAKITQAQTQEEAMQLASEYVGRLDRMQAEASMASSRASAAAANTNRLLNLAAVGDPSAIEQLGFDPRVIANITGLTTEDVVRTEQGITEVQQTKNVIDDILSNDRGIGAITGQIKNPTLSGFFQGGKPAEGAFDPSGLTRFIPGIGNVQGAVQSRNDRDSVLSNLQYVYNTEGFQEFIGLKESGLTFGSLDNAERIAIFAAANRLNASLNLEAETGKVTSYQGTDDQLRRDLRLVREGLQVREDELNSRLALTPAEQAEIANIR